MKVIFLDIDGVLNSTQGSEEYIFSMEVSKIKLLKSLIEETNTYGVVITSSWRYSSIQLKQLYETFDTYEIFILGQIRNPLEDDDSDNRGKQIFDYLTSSDDNIDKIVILDDNDDGISSIFYEDFVKTNRYFGLNEDIYNKAKYILNS